MDNEQYPPGNGEKFSDDPSEHLRIENEILRLRVRAELDGEYESDPQLSPELENEFLKNILAFEHRYARIKMLQVAELLGNPCLLPADKLDDKALSAAFRNLEALLADKHIVVEFSRPRDDRFKYRFITEELFHHETDDMNIEGVTKYFNYEEFHPDHEEEIADHTIRFLGDWFQRSTAAARWYLDEYFVQPDGQVFSRDAMIDAFNKVFASYVSFEKSGYAMDGVEYEILTDEGPASEGLGFAEGMIRYTAVLENGERKFVEGPFKFDFTRTAGRWRIKYFYLSGFNG
jgi:hypothetical protein